jgi:hypothetical protein
MPNDEIIIRKIGCKKISGKSEKEGLRLYG